MKKEQIIRPADIKEYIGFQFQGLADTLEQFDYPGMAKVVRASYNLFNKISPDSHTHTMPDCTLLDPDNLKAD